MSAAAICPACKARTELVWFVGFDDYNADTVAVQCPECGHTGPHVDAGNSIEDMELRALGGSAVPPP